MEALKGELDNLKKRIVQLKEEEKAYKEMKQLKEELSTIAESLEMVKFECEEKEKIVKTTEAHIASFQKQVADLLLQYDKLLEDNRNL